MKLNMRNNGYLAVELHNGESHEYTVHRLVLETYVGPRQGDMLCRHLNGIKTDNRLENLCWGTRSENAQDAIRHGTFPKPNLGKFGENSASSKLSNLDRRLIFSVFHDGARTLKELADHFNISSQSIKRIVCNTRWGSYV